MVLGNFLADADILWDRAGKTLFEKPEARTGRIMRVQVTNRGVVEDLTGYTLNLGWKSTIDETKFGLDAFEAADITKGIFELEYTSGMLTNIGTLKATLQLVPTAGNTVESNNFVITVTRSAVDAAGIQSETSFTALTSALVEVNGWNDRIDAVEADFIARANDMEAIYPQQLNSLSQQLEQIEADYQAAAANLTVDSEVILSRNGEVSLNTRLDKSDDRVDLIESDVFEEVENIIVNGDFINGLTNWSSSGTLVSGEFKMDTSLSEFLYQTIPAQSVGKLYFSANVYGGGSFYTRFYNASLVESSDTITIASGVTKAKRSAILTTTDTVTQLRMNRVPATGIVYIDKVLIINLTTAFGAGNEPSLAQMDKLMSQFTDNYFAGISKLFLVHSILKDITRIDGDITGLNALGLSNIKIVPTTHMTRVGYDSQVALGTGVRNTALGSRSQKAITDGSYNTGVGAYSLYPLTTGSYNVGVGYDSAKNLVDGSYNTAIGNDTSVANYSTAIGYKTAASAAGAVAIGVDSTGVAAGTTTENQIALGTAKHTVRIPGTLDITKGVFADTAKAVATYSAELTPALSSFVASNGATFNGTAWVMPTNGRITTDIAVEVGATYQIQLLVNNAITLTNGLAPMVVALGSKSISIFGANDANWNVTLVAAENGTVSLVVGGDLWSGNITGVSVRKVLTLPISPITINYKKFQTYGDNLAVGTGHGKLTSGDRNTSFGASNQEELSTGNYNTSVGNGAQRKLTVGSNNTATGYVAQASLETGMYNNAYGFSSQSALVSGCWNNAMGNESQRDLTTGHNNVAMGRRCQNGITTGWDNTAIGAKAAFQHDGSDGNKLTTASYQTVVGSETGQSSSVQADKLTALGYRARGTTNALALGAHATANGVGSVAVGCDSTGTGAIAENQDDMVLGTALHKVKVAGTLNLARYTPTSSADSRGQVGDITTDDNYLYTKTSTGWKRSALSAW